VIARLVPAVLDGTIVGVFGFARDVTSQRRAEVSRGESRQRFRSLFDQHPDSISMVDAHGRYQLVNAAAERLMGYRSAELIGRTIGMVLPGAEAERFGRFVDDTVRAGKPARYEQDFVRKDGARRAAEGTAVPIVVNGNVAGMFFMSRDITERKHLQEALAQLSRRLRELHRLAAELGADPESQASSALAFGVEELGFQSGLTVTTFDEIAAIEHSAGEKLPARGGDPLFVQLLRETVASEAWCEAGEPELERRSIAACGKETAYRSFLGVPLGAGGGRRGALVFASRAPTAPLTEFDREFVRSLAELAAAGIERAGKEKRLHGLANHDALTALPNRLLLSDRFAEAFAAAQRHGEQLAAYFIDVDKFKAINDTHGHHVGDDVLRIVAKRLRAACRAGDTVARLGGDEFIVLRVGPSGAEPEALAVRLRAEFQTPCDIEGLQLKISVGIGISVFPQDGKDERTLLESADAALYAAKACGAGCVRRFGVNERAGAISAAGLDRRSDGPA
jgi:diguanylate cyclase (GGDEF)-like protein/PAS domain S-box-containing protein